MAGPIKSSEVQEMHCKQCNKDFGRKVLAEAFCEDCEQRFCTTCLRYHNIYKPDHFVVTNSRSLQFDTEYCSSHKTRSLKFYCKACDVLSCVECRKEKHQNCESVSHLTELVDSFEEDRGNVELYVRAVQAATATIRQNVEECMPHGTHWERMVQAELKTSRDQINMTFDQLKCETDSISLPDKHDLETILLDVELLEQYTATYQSGCEKKRTNGKGYNYFIFQKKVQEQLKKLSEETKGLAQLKRVQMYGRKLIELKPDEITDAACLENINLKHTNLVPEHETRVNIREILPTEIGSYCMKLFPNIILELLCFIAPVVLLLDLLHYYHLLYDLLPAIGAGMLLSLLCKILLRLKFTQVALSFFCSFVLVVLHIIPVLLCGLLIVIIREHGLTIILAFSLAVMQKIGLIFCLLAFALHSVAFWLYQIHIVNKWYVSSVRWVNDGKRSYQSVTESFDGPIVVSVIWWILFITLAYFFMILISAFSIRFVETKINNRTTFTWKRSNSPFSEIKHQMFEIIKKF